MRNNISNTYENYKLKSQENIKSKIEEKWALITRKKEPRVEYRKRLDSHTVLKKNMNNNNNKLDNISKLEKDVNVLSKISEEALQEAKKQTLALEIIADSLKLIANKDNEQPPVKETAMVINKTPAYTNLGDENSKISGNNYALSELRSEQLGDLYNKIRIFRSKGVTWKNIASILNSEGISTLSGTGKWGPELLRYFMKKLSFSRNKKENKN